MLQLAWLVITKYFGGEFWRSQQLAASSQLALNIKKYSINLLLLLLLLLLHFHKFPIFLKTSQKQQVI